MSARESLPEMKIEIPKFTRCFLCVPLSCGLLIWGVLQVLLALALTIVIFVLMDPWYGGGHIFLCVLAALAWIADGCFSAAMVNAVYKKNISVLNLSYSYYVVKFYLLLVVLFIGFIMLVSAPYSTYRWYSVFDPITVYLCIENIALGVLCWLLQGYLTLLIRSEILRLGGRPCVNLKFKVQCIDMEDSDTHTPFQVDSLPTSDRLGVGINPPKYEDLNKEGEKKDLQSVEPV